MGGIRNYHAAALLFVALWSAAALADDAPARPTFPITEIQVTGNKLLLPEVIQTAMEPFTGPAKTPDDVEAARDSLEKLYRELGYKTVTVAIPKQSARDGVIRLEVAETAVHKVNIVGDRYTSREQLRSEIPALAANEVPNFEDLQKDLVYANRMGSRRVTPALHATTTPGVVDIDLMVEDHPALQASGEYNNRNSKGTTDTRAVANFSYDNLWQRGHSFSFMFQTAPQRIDDGKVYYAAYVARIGDSDWSVQGSGLWSSSDVAAFTGIDVVGKGYTYGLRLIRQLDGIEGFLYPSFSFGVDYKHQNNVSQLGASNVETPLTYYPITLGYSQLMRGETQSLQSDVSFVFAYRGSGSDRAELDDARLGARGQSLYLRASNSYSIDFLRYFTAALRATGQITDQPLVSGEQLNVGGMDSVRGYLEAEAAGDYGYVGSAELKLPSIPDFFPGTRFARGLQDFRPFAFADAAEVTVRPPYPDSSTRHSSRLFSWGGGLTMRIYDHLSAVLDYAMPERDGPYTKKGEYRVLFKVSASL